MPLASLRAAGACHACHVLETQRRYGGSGVGFRHDLTRGKVRSASSCFSPKTIRSDHQQWRQGCHRCTRCASVRRPLRGTCVPHALLLAVHGADRARGDKGDRKTIAAKVRDRGDDLTYWGTTVRRLAGPITTARLELVACARGRACDSVANMRATPVMLTSKRGVRMHMCRVSSNH